MAGINGFGGLDLVVNLFNITEEVLGLKKKDPQGTQ